MLNSKKPAVVLWQDPDREMFVLPGIPAPRIAFRDPDPRNTFRDPAPRNTFRDPAPRNTFRYPDRHQHDRITK